MATAAVSDQRSARASEAGLVAICVALGAAQTGGALSSAERALVRGRLTAASEVITPATVERVRSKLAAGGDPLGERFYGLRNAETRRRAGAIYTPAALLEPMVSWTLEQGARRVVDPGCGSGRFSAAIARRSPSTEIVAVDTDPLATLMTRAALAALGHRRSRVVHADFLTLRLPPSASRTAYLGNPPYVRHHDLPAEAKVWAREASRRVGIPISGLAGLHALFYLAIARTSRRGDVGCLVTSAEWLDVNYGEAVRRLLLEKLGVESIEVVEPSALPFGAAYATAAIVRFTVGSAKAQVRVARVGGTAAVGMGTPTGELDAATTVSRGELADSRRWSQLARRGGGGALPTTWPRREPRPRPRQGYVELGEICRVHRGAATGANAVWIPRGGEIDLPDAVLFPSVTRARELFAAGARLDTLSGLRQVVDLPSDLDMLEPADRLRVATFLARAVAAGVRNGYIAAHRRPWWHVGLPHPAPILASYMARRPPAFVVNAAGARHVNVAHGLYPCIPLSAWALDRLAYALRVTTDVASGRTYAGGLTKFEPREMERLLVPLPEDLERGDADAETE